MSLSGKVIAITGAGGDIGIAAIGHFLQQGARIAAFDLSREALDRVAGVAAFKLDVTDEDAVREGFAAAYARFGRIDGLVNGAGIEGVRTPIEQYPAEMFAKVLAVNVTGMFLCMKHVLPLLRAGGGGAIVNIASTAGIKGSPNMSAYIASKHAVIGLTRTAALEAIGHGIRVNALCPGPISGRMIRSIFDEAEGTSADGEARRQAIPARRYGEPAEVAAVMAFLLSDAASYVTGACYTVDGGVSAM